MGLLRRWWLTLLAGSLAAACGTTVPSAEVKGGADLGIGTTTPRPGQTAGPAYVPTAPDGPRPGGSAVAVRPGQPSTGSVEPVATVPSHSPVKVGIAYIDQGQYSVLVTVVIASAIVPTVIAQAFFRPEVGPAIALEVVSPGDHPPGHDGALGKASRVPSHREER